MGKLVVGYDNIPVLTGEGLPHLFGVLNAFGADDVPRLLENAKDQRGIRFYKLSPSAYGGKLHELVSKQEPQRAVDRLLGPDVDELFAERKGVDRIQK